MTTVTGTPVTARRRATTEPMRVLTTAAFLNYLGGIEVCTIEDTRELVARGHTVELLYALDGEQRATYERSGVVVRGPVSFEFGVDRALRDLGRFTGAARLARRFRPDVLWLSRPEHVIWAQVVSRLARIPLVVHLHHAPNYGRTRLVTLGVDRFIAVSDYMKRLWVEHGVPADKITVVHNAVPIDRYPEGGLPEREAARRLLGLPVEPTIVLFYGRISSSKGVVTLVSAWRALGLDPEEALLVLAGQGVGDPDVASAISALPAGAVKVLPPRADVVPLLHAADVVVAPSEEPESFGRVLVEAMSTGRPAIGSDVGGMPEILTGEFAELLVQPGDAAGLAARIRSLLDWRTRSPELGRRARASVAARFPSGTHVDGIEAVLNAATRGRRR